MANNQILIVGSNPNLVFYGWQAQSVPDTEVTIVNKNVDRTRPLVFQSSVLGNSMLKANVVESCNQLSRGASKYNIVILSSSSLQDFQVTCNSFFPYLTEDAIIIIESTGYVHLEPFVQLCIPKSKKFTICSIMNEFDIRQISSSEFSHEVRNKENRIYLGTTSNASLGSNPSFMNVLRLFQAIQENSSKTVSLLKSVNTKEFMTYQWKLALPRIVFNPLSIVFEAKYPEQLSSQILSKPLVSGLIKEIFRIVKKMDCKLVKGFENEANLLKNWTVCYPTKSGNDDFLDSPQLFYQFYRQYDLEIDLLLLQPILLGDDYKIGTPYLENLYSIMCQLIKLNDKSNDSIFFTRLGKNQSNPEYDDKMTKLNDLTKGLYQKEIQFDQINSSIKESEILKAKLNSDISNAEDTLRNLSLKLNEHDNQARMMKLQITKLEDEYAQKQINSKNLVATLSKEVSNSIQDKNVLISQPKPKAYRESIQPTDNLEDLTDIALYGDELDNNGYPAPNVQTPPSQVVPSMTNGEFHNASKGGLQRGFDEKNALRGTSQEYQSNTNLGNEAIQNNNQQNGFVPNGSQQNGFVSNSNQQNGFIPNSNQQNGFVPNSNQPLTSNGSQQNGFVSSGNQHNGFAPNGNQQNGYVQNGQPQLYHQNSSRSMPQVENQMIQQKHNAYNPNQGNGQGFVQQYLPQTQGLQNSQNYPQQNYSNGYNAMSPDQQPPHGLPANGMPINGMSQNLGNNRYQNGVPPTRSRISSINSYHDNSYGHNQQYSPQFGQQIPQNEPSFQNAAPIDPSLEQRFKANPKKQNRRSAFPHMNGNLEGFDLGGRGGMPGAQSILGAKQRTPNQMGNLNQQRKSSIQNLQKMGPSHSLTSQSQFLQLPAHQNESNGSTNSSSNSTNAPLTPQGENLNDNVQIPVPPVEATKPLGGVASSNLKSSDKEKKKKKGLFRK